MPEKQIKVLIVDDSVVAREFLRYIIESDPLLKVIGYAVDGKKALQLLQKLDPDVITMDITMPNLDGFETTRRIMQTKPVPVIIVSSLYSQNDVQASFHAMEAGALAILPRPVSFEDPQHEITARNLVETIKTTAGIKLITRRAKDAISLKPEVDKRRSASIEAVAIGASLGGPPAIEQILSALPATFPVPIFIVQHISYGFTQGLAEWLQKATRLNVRIPQDRELALPGTVYIAPDGLHMELIQKNRIALTKPNDKGLCPAVARLFQSVAQIYGPSVLGVMLTGMGRDGAEEMLLMKKRGAITLAQSAESCVMYGMPKAAVELGAVQHSIPLEQMAATIEQLVNASRA